VAPYSGAIFFARKKSTAALMFKVVYGCVKCVEGSAFQKTLILGAARNELFTPE
jgi:hypothetical protein